MGRMLVWGVGREQRWSKFENSNIKSGFVSSIAKAMNEKLVYPSSRTELETAIQELSLRHNREVYPEQPYNAANIVENFENPKFSFGVSESSED